MLVAAAVCPHPPLLVPQLSVAEPDWLRELRAACARAVRLLVDADPDAVVVVGAGPEDRTFDRSAGGSLAAYGVDIRAGGEGSGLSLALTLGAWLLDEAGWGGARTYTALAPTGTPLSRATSGAELVDGEERVALLVMGDGSAKRTAQSPGYLDERAGDLDAAVSHALASAASDALLSLDAAVATDLWAAGLPAWQALAGAARQTAGRIDGAVSYDAAPLGVGYFVATWLVRHQDPT